MSRRVGSAVAALAWWCLAGCGQSSPGNSLVPFNDGGLGTSPNDAPITSDDGGGQAMGGQPGSPDGASSDTGERDVSATPDLATASDSTPVGPDGSAADAQGSMGKPFPGVTMEKIADVTPTRLMVGPDEQRVAFSLKAPPGIGSGCGFAGDLSVAVLTAQGPKVTQLSANGAGLAEARFTASGSHIAFIQSICADRPSIVLAQVEGATAARNLVTASVFPRFDVQGGTVAWVARDIFGSQSTDQVGAARIDGAAVPAFPRGSGMRAMYLDPSGTAIDYDDAAGGWFRVVTGSQPVPGSAVFSPDGRTAAVKLGGAVSVRNVDGTNVREIATDCRCGTMLFSPDGARLAYDTSNATGDTAILNVYPIAGGPPVVLSFPSGLGSLGYSYKVFSPGGRWVAYSNFAGRMAIADTRQSGSFTIQQGPTLPFSFSTAEDLLAYQVSASSVWLAPLPFAGASALLDSLSYPLGFQPAAGSTRLAVLNNRETTTYLADLEIYDARTRARIAAVRDIQSGGRAGFELAHHPFWAGKVIVFAFNARKPPGGQAVFDLGAVTEDGSVSGTLATEVLQYEWFRDAKAPGRIFFVRSRASGGGLWTLALPD